MENEQIWKPFLKFGLDKPFYNINIEIFNNAIIACIILIFFAFLFRRFLYRKNIINDLLIKIGYAFFEMIEETIGYVDKKTFAFIFSLFFILLGYNLLSLIPTLEEPTKDINVSLAFAIFSFLCIHGIAIKELGSHYLEHWFKTPLSLKREDFFLGKNFLYLIEFFVRLIFNFFIAILLFPFEILSRMSLVMSLSFRLFGNIFGGSKIVELVAMFTKKSILLKIVLTFMGINLILMGFFGFFEGLMQAFIFTLVSLNNIGILLGDEFLEKKIKENNL